jgi:hypothetical protein
MKAKTKTLKQSYQEDEEQILEQQVSTSEYVPPDPSLLNQNHNDHA